MKKTFFGLLFIILICTFVSCSVGSYKIKNGVESSTSTKLSMTYDGFNTQKEAKIKVDKGESVDVKVKIVTEDGSLDAYIFKDNDINQSNYTGKNISNSEFTVTLSEEGLYTVRVVGRNHKGSFLFTWD